MSHKRVIETYEMPFKSADGESIYFPYTPLNGVVFVWPKPVSNKQGNIYVIEAMRESFKSNKGVVLAASTGVKNKKTGQWVDCALKVGDEILYDKDIPWNMMIQASDGKEYRVELMGLLDINALINDNEVNNAEQSVQNSSGTESNKEAIKAG